jgi:hypothetical protein
MLEVKKFDGHSIAFTVLAEFSNDPVSLTEIVRFDKDYTPDSVMTWLKDEAIYQSELNNKEVKLTIVDIVYVREQDSHWNECAEVLIGTDEAKFKFWCDPHTPSDDLFGTAVEWYGDSALLINIESFGRRYSYDTGNTVDLNDGNF